MRRWFNLSNIYADQQVLSQSITVVQHFYSDISSKLENEFEQRGYFPMMNFAKEDTFMLYVDKSKASPLLLRQQLNYWCVIQWSHVYLHELQA